MAVFLSLGRRLSCQSMIACSAEAFARERAAAEKRCMVRRGYAVTLRDIYMEMHDTAFTDIRVIDELMDAEIRLEHGIFVKVPAGVKLLESERRRGKRIIFVSEMYLSSTTLQDLLCAKKLFAPGDGIYVSCEYGVNKSSGELFKRVLATEGVQAEQIIHYGNSHGDIQGTGSCNIPARFLGTANLNRYEKILGNHAMASEGLTAMFAGTARITRNLIPVQNRCQASLRDIAASVLAPALTGFVIWLLRRAVREGLHRLYFISRDGQILMDIATQLQSRMQIDVECRYLYGSRQSWNRAVAESMDQSWLWQDIGNQTTLQDLLKRAGVNPEAIRNWIKDLAPFQIVPDRPLTSGEILRLRQVLNSPVFQTRLQDISRQKKKVLMAYLRQEGLFDNVPKGCVDVGWIGTLHETLSILISETGSRPIHGLFFGLKDFDTPWQDLRSAYLFDEGRDQGFKLSGFNHGLIILMEVFCAADHGSVYDFSEDGDRIEAMLAQGWEKLVRQWGQGLIRKTVREFISLIDLSEDLVNSDADARPGTIGALLTFWTAPSRHEAMAWGAFPWDAGQGTEPAITHLTVPYGLKDVFQLLVRGPKTLQKHNALWVEGSIMVSHQGIAKAVRVAFRVRRFLEKVNDRLNDGVYGKHYLRLKQGVKTWIGVS